MKTSDLVTEEWYEVRIPKGKVPYHIRGGVSYAHPSGRYVTDTDKITVIGKLVKTDPVQGYNTFDVWGGSGMFSEENLVYTHRNHKPLLARVHSKSVVRKVNNLDLTPETQNLITVEQLREESNRVDKIEFDKLIREIQQIGQQVGVGVCITYNGDIGLGVVSPSFSFDKGKQWQVEQETAKKRMVLARMVKGMVASMVETDDTEIS